ncbi:hypothetical protein BZA70DRAFT_288734 [Myxozyma melibiosi]|uniref:BZIP domain-containing protein n=1 Tax=Myxozyma melibiosi TaxID=54550 RepID=A0ABR1F9C9_9ASCO
MLSAKTSHLLYRFSLTVLIFFTGGFVIVTPADLISQSYRNKQIYNESIVAATYVAVGIVSLVICLLRLYAVRLMLADIPKYYVPGRHELPKNCALAIESELARCQMIKKKLAPTENVYHPGLPPPSQAGVDFPQVPYLEVLMESVKLLEEKARGLHPQLGRRPSTTLTEYIEFLVAYIDVDMELARKFIAGYEAVRYSGEQATEDEFRGLMRTFTLLLRSIELPDDNAVDLARIDTRADEFGLFAPTPAAQVCRSRAHRKRIKYVTAPATSSSPSSSFDHCASSLHTRPPRRIITISKAFCLFFEVCLRRRCSARAPSSFSLLLCPLTASALLFFPAVATAPTLTLDLPSSTLPPHPTFAKLDLEPNPFEQSFASKEGTPTSAQKALLPPVASLASPSSLLGTPASQGAAGYWSLNSLRSGPLSPAMLQGPQAAAFVDSHLRSGLTPNESGIRSGLTPGGSGSIFPAPSPTSAAIFGLTTPAGIAATSFPQTPLPIEVSVTSDSLQKEAKPEPRPQKPENIAADSASVAANGLFLLSQGQADANKSSVDASTTSNTANLKDDKPDKRRGNNRKNTRKADDQPQTSNKRFKGADGAVSPSTNHDHHDSKNDDERSNADDIDDSKGSPTDSHDDGSQDSRKMTDEEKRKNFLERNRVAALKCRQRKKQWLQSLQAKCDFYANENDNLTQQVLALREQVANLKGILNAHKDCSVSRSLPPGQDPIAIALGQDFVGNIQGLPPQQQPQQQPIQAQPLASRRYV